MSSADKNGWAQIIVNIALSVFIAMLGYIVSQKDAKDKEQDKAISENRASHVIIFQRILSNEKDIKFANEKLTDIKNGVEKIDSEIGELRKDLNTL